MSKELFDRDLNASPALIKRLAHGLPDELAENITIEQFIALIKSYINGGLIPKVVNIGVWNMDTTETKTLYLSDIGVDYSKIRNIEAWIKMDQGVEEYFYDQALSVAGKVTCGFNVGASGNYITLTRTTGGAFDSSLYANSSNNRGYLIIWYAD